MSILRLRIFLAVLLTITALIFSGCVTMESLQKKYPGYTVVGKERRESIQDVPVWLFSCISPNGTVKCRVESVAACADCYPNPGVNQCTINCNTSKGDRWDKRQIGTKKTSLYQPLLKLKSPTGQVVEEKVSASIYNEVKEGQVFQANLSAYEWYSKGYDYELNKKDYDTAIQYYLKAISIDPNHENALFGLGYIYNAKKEYAKAIEYYNRVLAINPRYKEALNNVGLAHENLKDYTKAESYYRKSIEVDPSYSTAWESLGYALYYQQKDNEAKEAWKKAVSLGKTSARDALKKYYNITF